MELELKHLAPYLPFGISIIPFEWKVNEYWKGKKVMLTGFQIDDDRVIFKHKDLISETNMFGIITFKIDECQPILRPLTDLDKEIEINGEKFIPGVKLAELKINLKLYIDISPSTNFDCKIVQKPFGKILKVSKLGDWVVLLSLTEPYRADYWIIEKLLEWNFDIFGLIDKSLAIDINKI